ncbi:MAG: hypothetical protein AAF587_08600 [Bacteroidota bacterium]
MFWDRWKKREAVTPVTVAEQSSEHRLVEQIDLVIVYLIGRLTPNSQTKPCLDYLENYLIASPGYKIHFFAQVFCMTEYTLINLDPECHLGRKSLREIIQIKFPLFNQFPAIQTVLVPPMKQREALCTFFFQQIMEKLGKHFGLRHKSLQTFLYKIDQIPSLKSGPFSPSIYSYYQEISRDVFDWATERLGFDYITQMFQETYQQIYADIGILEEADVLLKLLPTDIMTPQQLVLYMQQHDPV